MIFIFAVTDNQFYAVYVTRLSAVDIRYLLSRREYLTLAEIQNTDIRREIEHVYKKRMVWRH